METGQPPAPSTGDNKSAAKADGKSGSEDDSFEHVPQKKAGSEADDFTFQDYGDDDSTVSFEDDTHWSDDPDDAPERPNDRVGRADASSQSILVPRVRVRDARSSRRACRSQRGTRLDRGYSTAPWME